MSTKLARVTAALLFCFAAAPLSAQVRTAGQAAKPSAVAIVAENITARDAAKAGSPRATADSGKLFTGDVVEYRLSFTNTTSGSVKNVVLEDPLPNGLAYVEGTAAADMNGVVVEYSIDGGRTYSTQPMVRVVENGQEVTRPAPAARYTNIRWRVTGAVRPGARVTASFRARLGAGDQK